MIQRDRIRLTYQLEFESPFHCGTGFSKGLTDRAIHRDKDDYLYIPGSTIKGVLRENCELAARILGIAVRDPHKKETAVEAFFENPDIVERIFGSRYQESSIFFDNAWMRKKDKIFFDSSSREDKKYRFLQTENRTQTRLSRKTGTVMDGALYTSEFGISQPKFEGKIHGWLEGTSNELSDDLPGSYPLYLLVTGIYMAQRIGANRSTGMGRCRFDIQKLRVNDNLVENPKHYCEKMEDFICYDDAREEAI